MNAIDTTTFTESQQNAFVEGWERAGGPTDDCEEGVSTPWCCPWYWNPIITVNGNTPEEWGASWWEQCREEVEEANAEHAVHEEEYEEAK